VDIVEHYLNKSPITSVEYEDILCELALHDLFKRDNKQRFIDKVEADEMLDAKNNPLKVKSGTKSLWKQMKKELLDADSHKDLVDWGGNTKENKIKQLFGTSMTDIGKSQNNMSGGASSGNPSGEDWEAMIAIGLATIQKKDPSKEVPDEWSRIDRKGFWNDDFNRDIAEKLATAFKKNGYSPISQTGSGKGGAGVSSEWGDIFKEYGSGTMNKTPKTDIKGGSKKISLKKAGGSQAMSAKQAEAASTFGAAVRMYGKNYPSEVNKILDKFKTAVLDLSESGYRGSIDSLEKDIKASDADPKKMKKLKPVVDNLKQARDDGKYITSEMNRLFLSDAKFKDLFVFEAATGSVKFGDSSESRADTMVEIDTNSGKITSKYKMNTPSDISSLASQYKFYLSFKTSGNSTPYMALRGNMEQDPKKVTAWMQKQIMENKNFSAICPTFSTIIQQGFEQDEFGKRLLTESSFQNLNEWQMLKKVRDGIASVSNKVKDRFVKIWNWISERVSKAFDWIKKQGAKALDYLQKFFGIKLATCGINGKIELFSK
tara:strand:- start:21227 stop:22858 length:1632 start_codon:yes stop_codon:yes gene_type:complete